ncbi:MAG: hypothetical protein R3F34_07845 [Planctomycetota bacterium]
MTRRTIGVVGAGERIVNDGLPVIASLADELDLVGVWSRTPRTLAVGGSEVEVKGLEDLEARGLAGIDLLWVVVAKGAVPRVLERLVALGTGDTELVVETPVLLYKFLSKRRLLESFRSTWVSEDCAYLPIFETLDRFVATGAIGSPVRAVFDRCAYAYHGVAMSKRCLGARPISRATRRRGEGDTRVRTLRLPGGRSATIVEPREYAKGVLTLEGERGAVSDRPGREHLLEAVVRDDRCVGFRIGDVVTELLPVESELLGPLAPGGGVVPNMHGLKRVGLRRLFAERARREGGYHVNEGLEDMGVDWHLERFGLWLRNPLTSPTSSFPPWLLRTLGR